MSCAGLIVSLCLLLSSLLPSDYISGVNYRYLRYTTPKLTPSITKAGDSITANQYYLYPMGDPNQVYLDQYTQYQHLLDYYGESFRANSLAAVPATNSSYLLTKDVNLGCIILVCEYKAKTPTIVLIMTGTNDPVEWIKSGKFNVNLHRIISETRRAKAIPVLFTIPPHQYKDVKPYNKIIKYIGRYYAIPVVDYYSALQLLPNMGMSEDGVHPNAPVDYSAAIFTVEGLQYGYTIRNLLTLEVLHQIQQAYNK